VTLPVRRASAGSGGMRRGPARASSARRSADRVGALLVLLATVGALAGLCISQAFELGASGVELVGARYVDAATVTAALGLDGSTRPNLVTLRTGDLEAALRKLPAVDPARADAVAVRVALPDRLVITLHEREPMVVWETAQGRFLVDEAGVLFAPEGSAPHVPPLPIVHDERSTAVDLQVGGQLDTSDLEAVRRLAALSPSFLGSAATGLAVGITDDEGFTVDAAPQGWHAVFGFYTPTVRPPTLIDGQAQCLASLIAAGEARLATIYLAPGGDRCGTFTSRPAGTPAPSAKPTPAP
jgi:cell division septal protein FtsQ